MRLPLRLLVCALFLILPALCVRAGEGKTVSRPGVLHVTLDSAVRLALQKNFTIQVQEFEPKIARERVTQEYGIFDPLFSIGGRRRYLSESGHLRDPQTREPGTVITRSDNVLDSGIEGLTPLGTDYRFGLGSTNITGTSRGFNEFATGPTMSLNQPLLRGFGPNATMSQIRIARTNVEISEWELRSKIIDTITDVVYTYNDLHASIENLKVAILFRELARQLLQDNTRRATIGVMSPLDITTARAEVASREEGVILADRQEKDNEVTLKRLVTQELEPMLGIKVEIELPPFYSSAVDVHAGIRDALDLRPDFQNLLLGLKNNRVLVAFEKNAALPRLDLNASLGFLGFDSDFINSVGRIAQRDSLAWSAGATFSIPLGNHAAKGALNAARLQVARNLVELKRLEQQIVVDVDIAAGQVVTDRARIESTSEASRLAQESLDAGEQRLKAGTGTTFEVLELQKKLVEAQSAEIRARADHNKAVAEFNRKTGRTLRQYNVELK
jgi:outer membrane protein TolC